MLKKWYVFLVTGIMMLLCSPLSASAAVSEVRIYDEGRRLTESEYAGCLNRLQEAARKTGMNIGVVLGVEARADYTIDALADSTYDELFGKGTDGLLYYMDLKGRNPHDFISTSGMGQFYYTNSKENDRIAVMFDALDDYLYPIGSEDVPGALMQLADEVELYYEAGVPENYYFYDDEYREYYYLDASGVIQSSSRKPYTNWENVLLITFVAFFTGLLTAVIIFFVVKTRYKFKYTLSPTTYVNQKKVQYGRQYDNFVRANTSKVSINSDSGGGSGGSSGGGGFSSGGHGGGGHNR